MIYRKKRDSRGLYLGRALLWQASLALPYGVDSLPFYPSSYFLQMTAYSQSPLKYQ